MSLGGGRVQLQLLEILPSGAEVILLAGSRYLEGVDLFLRQHGFSASETASFGHRPFSSSQSEEHSESFPHVGEDLNGGGRGEFHAPSVPIQILNVIR